MCDVQLCVCACVFVQDALNGEEDLTEEEKVRRKAERRKAKRKVGKETHTSVRSYLPFLMEGCRDEVFVLVQLAVSIALVRSMKIGF